ncbi:MAG TPA: hypothetical protein PLD54_05075, partial [Candidatus Levybacteria bacterium]|nr:hypothetical protein [Candidatus Levybacteria bacterium]
MENTPSIQSTPTVSPVPDIPNNRFSNLSPKSIILFLAVIVVLIIGVFYGVAQVRNDSSDTKKDTQENTSDEIVNIAPYTLVYGSWSGNSSVIFAHDLSTGKDSVLAQLPFDIKKVSVIDDDTLMYIAQTNVHDQGREVVTYDLTTQQETVLLQASEGFGIDDYVLSPDKKYISLWEVQQTQDEAEVLLGGRSRVYTAETTKPNVKNLIYDEVATVENPVRYPLAILNDGTVFMDRFLPNSGVGWAYGMSVSNFTGTDKRDLANMQNGTYGTKPELSPDGKHLLFLGYDKSDGLSDVDGFRKAVITSNTISVLDTQSLEISHLTASDTTKYSRPRWNTNDDGSIIVTVLSSDTIEQGIYRRTVQDDTLHMISALSSRFLIGSIAPDKVLYGTQSQSQNSDGNLGSFYASQYTTLSIQDTNDAQSSELDTHANLVQFITLYQNALSTSSLMKNSKDIAIDAEQLQLGTFALKPEVQVKRTVQQSEPVREKPVNDDEIVGDTPSAPNNPVSRATPIGPPSCGISQD